MRLAEQAGMHQMIVASVCSLVHRRQIHSGASGVDGPGLNLRQDTIVRRNHAAA